MVATTNPFLTKVGSIQRKAVFLGGRGDKHLRKFHKEKVFTQILSFLKFSAGATLNTSLEDLQSRLDTGYSS